MFVKHEIKLVLPHPEFLIANYVTIFLQKAELKKSKDENKSLKETVAGMYSVNIEIRYRIIGGNTTARKC